MIWRRSDGGQAATATSNQIDAVWQLVAVGLGAGEVGGKHFAARADGSDEAAAEVSATSATLTRNAQEPPGLSRSPVSAPVASGHGGRGANRCKLIDFNRGIRERQNRALMG